MRLDKDLLQTHLSTARRKATVISKTWKYAVTAKLRKFGAKNGLLKEKFDVSFI